jgi:hypothetical protein
MPNFRLVRHSLTMGATFAAPSALMAGFSHIPVSPFADTISKAADNTATANSGPSLDRAHLKLRWNPERSH